MKRNDNFVLRQVEDRHVLSAVEGSGAVLPCKITMSETAAMIWNLLSADRTLEQLVSAMTGEYDVSPEEAEQDIRELLVHMHRLNLVRVSS